MGSKKRQRNEISRTRKTFDLATGYHIRGGEGDGYRGGAEYKENFNGMVEILQLERRNREEREREEERKHN